jgi:TRAP-type C4-dicarboxylate transport system permease small subunit
LPLPAAGTAAMRSAANAARQSRSRRGPSTRQQSAQCDDTRRDFPMRRRGLGVDRMVKMGTIGRRRGWRRRPSGDDHAVKSGLAVALPHGKLNDLAALGVSRGTLMQFLESFVLKLIRAMLGVLLLVSMVLICANSFGRYVLAAPIIWAEELLGFALVWLVYLGAVQVTDDDGHLRMDLLVQNVPRKVRRLLEVFGYLVFLAVSGLIIYQAYDSISAFHFFSQIAGLPLDVLHAIIPVSFGLMVLLVAVRLVRALFGSVDGDGPAQAAGSSPP